MTETQTSDIQEPARGLSLLARIAAARSGRTGMPNKVNAWLVPVAVLILWLPLAIWVGGRWLERGVMAEWAAIRAADRPAAEARAIAAAEHRTFGQMMARPAASLQMERLAVALPPDDRLVAVSSALDGEMVIEVMTVDPARLRSALRGSGAMGPFKTLSEQREDAGFRVTLSQGDR